LVFPFHHGLFSPLMAWSVGPRSSAFLLSLVCSLPRWDLRNSFCRVSPFLQDKLYSPPGWISISPANRCFSFSLRYYKLGFAKFSFAIPPLPPRVIHLFFFCFLIHRLHLLAHVDPAESCPPFSFPIEMYVSAPLFPFLGKTSFFWRADYRFFYSRRTPPLRAEWGRDAL